MNRSGPSVPPSSLRRKPLDGWWPAFLKRGIDITVSLALAALVMAWLWPLIALAIKLDSRGPVFYKQERYGLNNKRFLCFKFRTMIKDSRDCDEQGRYRPTEELDERMTRVGRVLRKASLDELPQFLNILKGEMSLVGPRPHPVLMHNEYKDTIPDYQLRHLVKPGLTGWAQVNGLRGPVVDPECMRRRVEHDLGYIDNWSLGLDLKIVLLTLKLLIKGDGQAF
jgi:putative colanic acid biosynthesis UDP-glucose lipid carrier transferase